MTRNAFQTMVVLLGVAASVGAGGCAGRQATTLAGNLSRLTHEYSAARAAKAEAELRYYTEQVEILRAALSGTVVSRQAGAGGALRDVPVTESLAYTRILVGAQRDGIIVAESLSLAPGAQTPWAALIRFLDQGLRDDREAYLESMRRQQELRATLLTSLADLDLHEQRLRAVRDRLLRLERPPSLETSVSQLVAIGEAVRKQLNDPTTAGKQP